MVELLQRRLLGDQIAPLVERARVVPLRALRTYEQVRIERATTIQEMSRARKQINHLPDGFEQQERDVALSQEDPLVSNGWLYDYDAELAAKEALTR